MRIEECMFDKIWYVRQAMEVLFDEELIKLMSLKTEKDSGKVRSLYTQSWQARYGIMDLESLRSLGGHRAHYGIMDLESLRSLGGRN